MGAGLPRTPCRLARNVRDIPRRGSSLFHVRNPQPPQGPPPPHSGSPAALPAAPPSDGAPQDPGHLRLPARPWLAPPQRQRTATAGQQGGRVRQAQGQGKAEVPPAGPAAGPRVRAHASQSTGVQL